LKLTQRQIIVSGGTGNQITPDDLYVTLSGLTGLPRSILDDRQGLDLAELRQLFETRVLGQPEAIDCLVERVAMIKSGLTDATRPLGVFLFAGPTGTGKTEIAKTLAEFLFGSPDRMVRLDMSELQTEESVGRIVGDVSRDGDTRALVHQIQKQPFSLVLLDEFEKAHPSVWNLFLQVFDDGRLTDRSGNTADFRHAIIILTSNLGATISAGLSIGFQSGNANFSMASVEKAIAQTFRREFVNRLDRVVIFRPLSRVIMRDILLKELNDVIQRRGLRNREWAIEWEDSAIEFLLQKGFAADLGARPLKRAVERYLLSPLAITIVNHQFPQGDQFLFVRSDGARINVEFVDPDQPEAEKETPEPTVAVEEKQPASLKALMLDARGTSQEVGYLQHTFAELQTTISSEAWQTRKQEALNRTYERGFWEAADRYTVLGTVEYMDRIETGLSTAGSLLNRLNGQKSDERTKFPREILGRLAQQLYLVSEAYTTFADSRPRDAFLCLEANLISRQQADLTKFYARQLADMYRSWASKRKMHLKVLKDDATGDNDFHCIFSVQGFGAFSILQPEAGLHVFEAPKEESGFQRYRVRVRVVAQPDAPAKNAEHLLQQALAALSADADVQAVIVRRYRREPSPLVRDNVGKWRTGRLNRVLDGDFDLFG
ncbi:MAG: AAA family ATPase, partial [Calditrichaeota bacterium]|nr:AAA family ATPase [Calditrichota bacterium]